MDNEGINLCILELLGIVEKIKMHGMGTSVTLAPAWGIVEKIKMDGMGTSVTLAPAWEPMVGGELHRTCREVHEFLLTKN